MYGIRGGPVVYETKHHIQTLQAAKGEMHLIVLPSYKAFEPQQWSPQDILKSATWHLHLRD